MTSLDTTELRRASPWYAWDVSEGVFYATLTEASANRPKGSPRLLRQYRFDDDGSLAGRAIAVWPRDGAS